MSIKTNASNKKKPERIILKAVYVYIALCATKTTHQRRMKMKNEKKEANVQKNELYFSARSSSIYSHFDVTKWKR